MPTRHTHLGFTIVELLVVITIIVVLLALLMPAMDKALYRAEMTLCAATLRGLGTSVVTYAMDFKRHYPGRYGEESWQYIEMNRLSAPLYSTYDLRVTIRDYVAINKQFDCPFSDPIEFVDTDADTAVYANYGWWFGSPYAGFRGMRKLGDRFTANSKGVVRSFNVLAGDYDASEGQSSHGDHDGVYSQFIYDNSDAFTNLDEGVAKISASVFKGTYAARGPVDLNFVLDDLSAAQHEQALPFEASMDFVPHRMRESNGIIVLVPPGR